MASLAVVKDELRRPGAPSWIEPSLHVTAGRDPLGLQTITLDRIMPILVPGILVLSQRARYFSLHAFLLDEYQRKRLPPNNNDLSSFIKRREFEYAVAVQLCPRGCGQRPVGMVGKTRAAPAVQEDRDYIRRRESVESPLGGYGLYYRTPMIDMGVVVPAGTALGDTMVPVDILDPAGPGAALAEAFRSAVADTEYFREHMFERSPIPRTALEELSQRACLCRLAEHPDEQAVLRRLLFDPAAPPFIETTEQRRRSFALLLREVAREPEAARSNGAFMGAVWEDFLAAPAGDREVRRTIAEWAALAAKDWWQESLSSVWAHFLRVGALRGDGLSPQELDTLIRTDLVPRGTVEVLGHRIDIAPESQTTSIAAAVATATADLRLDDLQAWAARANTTSAGLLLLFALRARIPGEASSSSGWLGIGTRGSEWQPSVLQFLGLLDRHLDSKPSLADTLVWLVRRFVINAHEQIAYSKLPEFTFRFRWEDGRLHFYTTHGFDRLSLGDVRRSAMAQISEDVGLWQMVGGTPELTAHGEQFIAKAFAT